MTEPARPKPSSPPRATRRARKTVAGRLLSSYLLVLVAFLVTVGWSFTALRAAADDAKLLRAGYVPVLVRIGGALAEQNIFNTQLNHLTAGKSPADAREWIETSLGARPRALGELRESVEKGLGQALGGDAQRFRDDVIREVDGIQRSLDGDSERFALLYQALAIGDRQAADRAQDELVKHETEVAARLRALRARVEGEMEKLTTSAERREARSILLLVGLGLVALIVGVGTSLYASRVLAPLTVVTDRANAVAHGDLTPRAVVATNDEIGELAETFESMVAAIQRARSELVQAERLATIGKMAAHVTHEIRNPLSSIGLNVELLEEEVARLGGEPAQLVLAIKAEVERLSRIAEQYLSVARRPRPSLARERVDDLVRELVAFVTPELSRANVAVRVEAEPNLPEVELDESQLRQALLNLIRNAREAMPKGGELVILVRAAEGGGVELCVDDTGAGIPDDVRASIFDPFFTTKQRGTGLGLAVTREIVEAHNGTIACEAREVGGTRFKIELPAATAAQRPVSGRSIG